MIMSPEALYAGIVTSTSTPTGSPHATPRNITTPPLSPERPEDVYTSEAHAEENGSLQLTNEDVHVNLDDGAHPALGEDVVPGVARKRLRRTRTIGIIKNHALKWRFEIEKRIMEEEFEIVKERQMEFDTETDPETLFELFGEDAHSFSEGPVWVYVLERHRAVEAWSALIGPADPLAGKSETPAPLRVLYGLSANQNGLMGSPDTPTAEIQIASLFASSPPFPRNPKATSDTRSRTNSGRTSNTNGSGKPVFRARPVPATNAAPDITPRTTRSAALRAGIAVNPTPSAPRLPPTKERLAETFANVPGHKRRESIAVASTAAPTIAPRMTRAASLRLGHPVPAVQASPMRRALTDEQGKSVFEGIPGHKRRETISVGSSKAPTLVPRLNKSAALRAMKDAPPPSSFMFRSHPNSTNNPKPITRTPSQTSLNAQKSKPLPTRPSTQASGTATLAPPRTAPRASSATSLRPAPARASRASIAPSPGKPIDRLPMDGAMGEINGPPKIPEMTAKPRPRPSSVSAPSIAPRTNRSAALRAKKMELENAQAAQKAKAALAKKEAGRRIPAAGPAAGKVTVA
ncbi:hypothetical protein BD779DRAFT_1499896 [Infundibulicybe gibba]|nr:hypothetical protein BD779DRAFT_1499896 [Infundibulicybe gibba]